MDTTLSLGIFAGLVQAVAFIIYNRSIFRGTSIPNAATWSLWAFLAVLSATSYAAMTDDIAKYFLPLVSAVANIATFCYASAAGKFGRMDAWDCFVLIVGFVAIAVWWWYRSATYANMLAVLAIALAFVPTYRGVWHNHALEHPLPWYLWSAAYALATLVVLLRWQGRPEDLALPVSGVLLHLAVAMLTQIPRPSYR